MTLKGAYPTDANDTGKRRRQLDNDTGVVRQVQHVTMIVDNHHDDCGEDLSSLHDKTTTAIAFPCDFDTDDALSDEDHDVCMNLEFGNRIQAFPIDVSKVAKAQPGSAPHPGPDHRAPKISECKCPGCKHMRARNDWAHTREIGQCKYPYDEPWIP